MRRIEVVMASDRVPESRTTPKPPRPGGVERATMSSWGFNYVSD
jgi:hypothetical protein